MYVSKLHSLLPCTGHPYGSQPVCITWIQPKTKATPVCCQ